MLSKALISTAVGALMASGAMAQTMQEQRSPAANSPPASGSTATMSGKFISSQTADQWAFSKFKGTDVLGPNNEHIGDVNDVIFDKAGKVHAVVVGVGGFLGIGEKDVAIDMTAFQVVPDSNRSNDPNNLKLKVSWTKDELKNAPAFAYYRASGSGTTSSSGAPTTGMAPRDRAPGTAPSTTAPAGERTAPTGER